jgi:hypothetical protein
MTTETPQLVISRVFDAPREVVYRPSPIPTTWRCGGARPATHYRATRSSSTCAPASFNGWRMSRLLQLIIER